MLFFDEGISIIASVPYALFVGVENIHLIQCVLLYTFINLIIISSVQQHTMNIPVLLDIC